MVHRRRSDLASEGRREVYSVHQVRLVLALEEVLLLD